MEKAIIIKMDEVDLINIIRQVIREEIKSLLKEVTKQEEEDVLLSRKEVVKLLQISLATLYNYQKYGRIPFYRIGGRVLYKKFEVMKAIEVPIKCGRRI